MGTHYIILPHGFSKTHPHLVKAHEERGQRGQDHSSKRLAQERGIRLKLIDPPQSHDALRKMVIDVVVSLQNIQTRVVKVECVGPRNE